MADPFQFTTRQSLCHLTLYGLSYYPPPPTPPSGASAQRGPGSPHSWGFWITHLSRQDSSGRRIGLEKHNTQKRQTTMPRRDSNPQIRGSEQRRTPPQSAPPLGSAWASQNNSRQKCISASHFRDSFSEGSNKSRAYRVQQKLGFQQDALKRHIEIDERLVMIWGSDTTWSNLWQA